MRHIAQERHVSPAIPPVQAGTPLLRARFGGWLQGVDAFDVSLFSLAANELELMDPQQRLLLEVSWEVLQAGQCELSSTLAGKPRMAPACACRPGAALALGPAATLEAALYPVMLQGVWVRLRPACLLAYSRWSMEPWPPHTGHPLELTRVRWCAMACCAVWWCFVC